MVGFGAKQPQDILLRFIPPPQQPGLRIANLKCAILLLFTERLPQGIYMGLRDTRTLLSASLPAMKCSFRQDVRKSGPAHGGRSGAGSYLPNSLIALQQR